MKIANYFFIISFILTASSLFARIDIYNSGGPIMPEQAAYDVTYYDLSVSVNPADSSISGSVLLNADIVLPMEYLVVDLDTLLDISTVTQIQANSERIIRSFNRDTGKVWIPLNRTYQPGETISMLISYSGRPRVAPAPPWQGGFTWKTTQDGFPWIATSCQGEGSDIWWPSKDHVSDEPDSMHIRVRVPDPLICASNGKLISVENHPDNSTTFHWFVSTTINIYNVALNIAPYKLIENDYQSVAGEIIPVKFWVLPEDYEKGKAFMPEIIEHLAFFEKVLGPYPFRADKYGVVQTPHLGMEHQTIIAYGANFKNAAMTGRDFGFDALHHHELSHEWWGNLVTNIDWKDMWIHEGFGTYMQALYVEQTQDMATYFKMMDSFRQFNDQYEIAPYKSQTSEEIGRAPIYAKGAWVLHTLRYLIGDEEIYTVLRRMAYPDPAMEKVTDGSQTRFVSTQDFISIAEKYSGMKLDWFFEMYTRQPKLPRLAADIRDNKLRLQWKTPGDLKFPMPVDVKIGEKIYRLDIQEEGSEIDIPAGQELQIDPFGWVLFDTQAMRDAKDQILEDNYKEARTSCQSAMLFKHEKKSAEFLLKHINYMEKNIGASPDNFKNMAGKYKVSPRFTLNIELDDGDLYLAAWRRGTKKKLLQISDLQFITTDANRVYNFVADDTGKIVEISIESGESARTYSGKKVD
jgi:aminopeptidase N